MDKREQLQERYEDALFAIMMDELASVLGEEAMEESERLNSNPAAAVPERVDKRCMQTIRRHFRRAAAKKAGQMTLKAAGNVVMVFGLASALFIGAFATSETVRAHTMNLIVETFGEHTDFYFAPEPSSGVPQIKAGWVPEGFELDSERTHETNSWFLYTGSDTHYIQGIYTVGDGNVMSVDTENADVIYISVHDAEAMLAVTGDSLQIAWGAADKDGFVCILAEGISQEELIQVAENIGYND